VNTQSLLFIGCVIVEEREVSKHWHLFLLPEWGFTIDQNRRYSETIVLNDGHTFNIYFYEISIETSMSEMAQSGANEHDGTGQNETITEINMTRLF
jgi:hypothetical protein